MIGEKRIKIMSDITPIEKTEVDEEKNFKFAKTEEIVAMVRPLLVKYKVAIIPSKILGFNPQGNKVFISMKYQLIDMEDSNKDCIEVEVPASGYDEKGRAVFGALTGAYRYVMQQSFAIPVVDEIRNTSSENDDNDNQDEAINNNEIIGLNENMEDIKVNTMSQDDLDAMFGLPKAM